MSEIMSRLVEETGIPEHEWDEFNGPDSGHGVDRWFRHKPTGRVAYVNDDMGDIAVSFPTDSN